MKIQEQNGVPPGAAPTAPGKDGIYATTRYRPGSAIHAYLLYVSCFLFARVEMEFGQGDIRGCVIAVLCAPILGRGVKSGCAYTSFLLFLVQTK